MLVVGPVSWLFASSESSTPEPPTPPPAPGIPIPRRVPTILWLRETPIEQLGLHVLRASGYATQASIPVARVESVPMLTGGRYEGVQATAPRVIDLEGHHLGSDFGARARWLDRLAEATRGLVPIRWADTPDRVMYGIASVVFAESASPLAFVEPTLRVRVTITCADTASYSRWGEVVPLGTTPVPVPLGTLPSGGELGVAGPYTGDLRISVLAPTGVEVDRLGLEDITLGAGEAITIRLDAPHVLLRHLADGTAVDVTAWRNVAGSTRWWQPSPAWGDQPPRLVLVPTDPESTVTGWFRYRRAWA